MITIDVDTVGWQDDEGTEFFAPPHTPYGPLENLRTRKIDEEWVIEDAGITFLLPHSFQLREHEHLEQSPLFDFRILSIDARNGWVKYRVFPDEVQFSDTGVTPHWLGVKDSEDWIPEGEKPSYTRREIKEVPVRNV